MTQAGRYRTSSLETFLFCAANDEIRVSLQGITGGPSRSIKFQTKTAGKSGPAKRRAIFFLPKKDFQEKIHCQIFRSLQEISFGTFAVMQFHSLLQTLQWLYPFYVEVFHLGTQKQQQVHPNFNWLTLDPPLLIWFRKKVKKWLDTEWAAVVRGNQYKFYDQKTSNFGKPACSLNEAKWLFVLFTSVLFYRKMIHWWCDFKLETLNNVTCLGHTWKVFDPSLMWGELVGGHH